MSETNSTTTAQRAGVVARGLRALADHIDQHHLPEPGSIELEADHLEFHITGDDAKVWTASLGDAVDEFRQQPTGNGLEVLTVLGRLPHSGVRVVIEWIQIKTSPVPYLSAVTR